MNVLIRHLLDPKRYDPPVEAVSLKETHISWVLLAGDYAYKIKKPVDFGFVDFSTLEKRRFFCAEELRLNRRLAPRFYLAVVGITGAADRPAFDGSGKVFEYAVKMRRFPQEALLDRLIEASRLEPSHVDALADEIAAFHAAIERSTADDGHGAPCDIHAAVMENFEQILPQSDAGADRPRLASLRAWCDKEFKAVEALLSQRKAEGFVRECHGDLHLGNIVLIENRPVPFDCIEFSEKLRWVDVISEIAFTVMDLTMRQRPDYGYRLLNRYLVRTGDYSGLRLLRYYLVYRALVRAKIAGLTLAQRDDEAARRSLSERCRGYLALAERFTYLPSPLLAICHGFSGSGKSYFAAQIAERLPAIWLRSDVERKRLAGYGADAATGSGVTEGIYAEEVTRATYRRLADVAETLLSFGFCVIVDAAFLKRRQRDLLRKAAEVCGADYFVLDIRAPYDTLRGRMLDRLRSAADPSEADLRVLDYQIAHAEPLTPEELRVTLGIANDARCPSETPIQDIIRRLTERRCRQRSEPL